MFTFSDGVEFCHVVETNNAMILYTGLIFLILAQKRARHSICKVCETEGHYSVLNDVFYMLEE